MKRTHEQTWADLILFGVTEGPCPQPPFDLRRAKLAGAPLAGADLRGADLRDADLRGADLQRAALFGATLRGADLRGADLRGAGLHNADLRRASLAGTDLDACSLTGVAVGADTDLVSASWASLSIEGTRYERSRIDAGDEVLPFGMGRQLRLLLRCARLEPLEREAVTAVADHAAAAAPSVRAEVIDRGGGGTELRLSVPPDVPRDALLQVGDGFLRLLGVGDGPDWFAEALEQQRVQIEGAFEAQAALAARRNHTMLDEVLAALERIGRERLEGVTLSGFDADSMAALRDMALTGSELAETQVLAEAREASVTVGQRLTRELYEQRVSAPVRTLVRALIDGAAAAPTPDPS